MIKLFTSLALLLLLISCNKETIPTPQATANPPFVPNVIVLGQGQDCGTTYLIKFNNNAVGIPANSYNNIFYALNLPSQYKVDNLPLKITFRLPTNSEIPACTAMGTAFPQLFIETATNQ